MSKPHQPAPLPLTRTLVSVALLIGALSSCGGAGTPAAAGVGSITVSPATVTVPLGGTAGLSATTKDAQGHTLTNVTYAWKSSNEAVARVAGGTLTGLQEGRATVTASAGGVTPVAVNVTAPAAFDLSLSTDKLPVVTGAAASLNVNVTRRSGFTGAVTLTLQGLPAGASAAPITVAGDQTAATITVRAALSAAHSFPTGVTVAGTSGDQVVTKALTVTVRGPAGSVDPPLGRAAPASWISVAGTTTRPPW
ncbi:Ig-like domain-containing protein [Deinococcus sonorensis]|uniref:Ig-like domain-containing protein n=2 Tax=Deinococcus sonorensis TaxID=309891 RepID=A0AAU7U5Y8_9DEIO